MDDKTSPPEPGHPERPEPGGVPPSETPPGEDGLSGAGPYDEKYNPPKGWGPWPLIALMVVVALFAVFYLIGYLTR
jgi:hypothetical protein